jgi:glycosyltransferase involved in cell wall biosynthesis
MPPASGKRPCVTTGYKPFTSHPIITTFETIKSSVQEFPTMVESSLIIATYNWPEALDLVLQSVLLQTKLPSEVIIADDGSGLPTRQLIERHQQNFPVPLKHAWQEDKGFRAARSRNNAAALSSGRVLMFLDGDLIMSPEYVEDALEYVKKGQMSIQNRVLLSEGLTRELINGKKIKINFFSKGILANRKNCIRIPAVNKIKRTRQDFKKNRGGLLSVTREDYFSVRGYDESFEGWGNEDKDLIIRLMHHGVKKKILLFQGRTYHLYHKLVQHNSSTTSMMKVNDTIDNKRIIATTSSLPQ